MYKAILFYIINIYRKSTRRRKYCIGEYKYYSDYRVSSNLKIIPDTMSPFTLKCILFYLYYYFIKFMLLKYYCENHNLLFSQVHCTKRCNSIACHFLKIHVLNTPVVFWIGFLDLLEDFSPGDITPSLEKN